MYQEELNKELQEEGRQLKVKFKELDDMCELIDRVDNWKSNVSNFLDNQTIA